MSGVPIRGCHSGLVSLDRSGDQGIWRLVCAGQAVATAVSATFGTDPHRSPTRRRVAAGDTILSGTSLSPAPRELGSTADARPKPPPIATPPRSHRRRSPARSTLRPCAATDRAAPGSVHAARAGRPPSSAGPHREADSADRRRSTRAAGQRPESARSAPPPCHQPRMADPIERMYELLRSSQRSWRARL